MGFERAGFEIRWQVEIEPDAVNVLARHWPSVRRHRDINAVVYGKARNRQKHGLCLEPVDVMIGGFPCQDVSVAGKREGLSGSRSGLFFAFMRAIRMMRRQHNKPDVVVIENVPGLLSSQRGRDFHAVLSEVAECGFRRAYRILDSQYFGVPQRRRRVFIVGRARTLGRDAFPILFESIGGDGDSATGDETRARVAATLRGRASRAGVNVPGRGGEDDSNLVVGVHANQRGELRTSGLAGSLNGSRSAKQYEGVLSFDNRQAATDAVPATLRSDSHGANPMVSYAVTENMRNRSQGPANYVASAITASTGHHGHSSPRGDGQDNLVAATLKANSGRNHIDQDYLPQPVGVRRLTPLECERLQGFPDGWTCLCGEGHRGSLYCTCPDTPRYKGLGNAVTVPVAQWIAERIQIAEGRK